MKLSTKARYGLKAMCVMAQNEGRVMPLARLAEESDVTERYLEQVLLLLRKSGLVSAQRGAAGGYFLAKPADEISVGETVRALEDGLEFVDCISGECRDKESCRQYRVWRKLYGAINDTLDSMTLKSLTEN